MTTDDRLVLAFLGAHQIGTEPQVARLQERPDHEVAVRISRLVADGLVRTERLIVGEAPLLRITALGLAAIESRMKPAGLSLQDLRGQIAAGWLWIAARAGAFGAAKRVLSQLEMKELDRSAEMSGGALTGFRLRLDARSHYPAVAVEVGGHRMAIELELWPRRRFEPDVVFGAYREQSKVDRILVLVDERRQIEPLRATAEQIGVADRVVVRGVVTGAKRQPFA